MKIELVSEAAVRRVARRPMVLAAVKQALIALSSGDGRLFPVTFGHGPDRAWSVGLKSGHVGGAGALGFKYGSYFPANRARAIPAHSSTTVLIDPETGYPQALVNATYLNGLRTAAANAAAVEALARPDARVLGVIGGGHQAAFEVRAVADVRKLELVKVWNRTPEGAEHLRLELADLGVEVRTAERAETVRGSDLIITVTAAREPLVMDGEVAAGAHISAMGADQSGKQELDPALVVRSRLFADHPEQSVALGELQHAARTGAVSVETITPLGAVLSGQAAGRSSAEEITIFDSSGVALQDLMVAQAVLQAARQEGLTQQVEF
jgi:ornithine cyclodeaminase